MGVLKLSYTTYSDTLSRQQGDSLLRKAVQLAPDNPYYKETLATYLANSAKYQEAINLYEELAEGHETDEILSHLALQDQLRLCRGHTYDRTSRTHQWQERSTQYGKVSDFPRHEGRRTCLSGH